MTNTKSLYHQVPINILVNAFSVFANVQIAINQAILEKLYPVFPPGCAHLREEDVAASLSNTVWLQQ